ncbi:MAG: 4Fe-4S binding protein [Candidatus Bathyarchaeia archaeon]
MAKQTYKWKTLGRIPLTEAMVKEAQKRMAAWSWRVFKPVIDLDLCTNCWVCVNACPEGVIDQTEDGPVIDYNLCKGCGVCHYECRFDAIAYEREK